MPADVSPPAQLADSDDTKKQAAPVLSSTLNLNPNLASFNIAPFAATQLDNGIRIPGVISSAQAADPVLTGASAMPPPASPSAPLPAPSAAQAPATPPPAPKDAGLRTHKGANPIKAATPKPSKPKPLTNQADQMAADIHMLGIDNEVDSANYQREMAQLAPGTYKIFHEKLDASPKENDVIPVKDRAAAIQNAKAATIKADDVSNEFARKAASGLSTGDIPPPNPEVGQHIDNATNVIAAPSNAAPSAASGTATTAAGAQKLAGDPKKTDKPNPQAAAPKHRHDMKLKTDASADNQSADQLNRKPLDNSQAAKPANAAPAKPGAAPGAVPDGYTPYYLHGEQANDYGKAAYHDAKGEAYLLQKGVDGGNKKLVLTDAQKIINDRRTFNPGFSGPNG